MVPGRPGFLRENAFLVAAIALPVLVGLFFVIASSVPRWTVPDPAFDLVMRAARPYDATPSRVIVNFDVRDGRVRATVRPAPDQGYVQVWALLYFDHRTMTVRELPVDLPTSLLPGEEERVVEIEALANVQVSSQATAPDGYTLENDPTRSPGLVGDLFGVRRSRQGAALVNGGRIVRVELPSPFQSPYQSVAYGVGWVLGEESR